LTPPSGGTPWDIDVIYTPLKSAFNGLQFRRWHHRSIFIRLAVVVVASQSGEITRNSDKIWPYTSSRSSKVIDLGVNRKPMYDFLLKSDTVAVLAVLPQYPRYYRGNGYNFYGITAVLGPKYAGFPWGWGPVLRYYRVYGVEFFSCTRKLVKCACKVVRTLSALQCQLWVHLAACSPSCLCFNTFRLQLVFY